MSRRAQRPPASAAVRLVSALGSYARIGWWGLFAPRLTERAPLTVVQGVIRGAEGVLLAMRDDLWGWELPGGTPEPGESPAEALRREIAEETGLEVEVGHHVGDYVRTGFRPHTAVIFVCSAVGGRLRAGPETLAARWFAPDALPDGLFPWYRAPIEDAEREGPAVERHEHQGPGWVARALAIDLRQRLVGPPDVESSESR